MNGDFRFKLPIEVHVKINWERIYAFLKENPDISPEGFKNNMVYLWEGDEDLVKIYSE